MIADLHTVCLSVSCSLNLLFTVLMRGPLRRQLRLVFLLYKFGGMTPAEPGCTKAGELTAA